MKSPEPLIRIQAVRSLNDLPGDQKITQVAPLLNDKVRGVRIAAADILLDAAQDEIPGLYRQSLNKATDEYY